ncbi:hypothetical protein [Aurantiacibacter sp. D1-12]|uniref:hypothetical protein n=1 Tax=Aurantiacibacter sp. D1-12 TaxID=2993658 RepID=UPI00237D1403|nr:hypothetical protein [Aurantiacibacter sp. D1-12]MDE1468429.1 hypothetical protein [Aurantiacibacter sp. D1-12]
MIKPAFATLLGLVTLGLTAGCGASGPLEAEAQQRYVIYLHGRIIEDQGLPAISERYGEYKFDEIVRALRGEGFEVIAPLRDAGADPQEQAAEVSEQVLQILDRGVLPEHITIIGASKGAYIASLVSDTMAGPQLRYVLLAGCSAGANEAFLAEDRVLNGYVLTIRDRSDTELAGSCAPLTQGSARLASFAEIETDTGLEHGLIYSPHPAWFGPAVDWANGHTIDE